MENSPDESPLARPRDSVLGTAFTSHRSVILVFTALGFAAALAILLFGSPSYESTSSLRFHEALSNPTDAPGSKRVLTAEKEILASNDLAGRVVDEIGLEAILPGGTRSDAIAVIHEGIAVKVLNKSDSILEVRFGNRDPELARQILEVLLAEFNVAHQHARLSRKGFSIVAKEVDRYRSRLNAIVEELGQLEADAGASTAKIKNLRRERKVFEDKVRLMENSLQRAEAARRADLESSPAPVEVVREPTEAKRVLLKLSPATVATATGGLILGIFVASLLAIRGSRQ